MASTPVASKPSPPDEAHQARSFCRICAGSCALILTVENDRVVAARGDKSNPQTQGYACIKGLYLHEAHNSPDRLLHPLKRRADGSFERIGLEQALDEIALKLRTLLDSHGADAIAGFRGTLNYSNLAANHMLPDWLQALGSKSFFSTMTIDQSAKWITFERLGGWAAGRDPYDSSDVLMFVGTNPLVSLSTFNCVLQNPGKALKAFKERGGKVIVIDPRRTETAYHADVFLQPLPGEDPTLLAGILHLILDNGWQDAEFCSRYVDGLDELRTSVEPFTPAYVSTRAGVPQADLHRAAEMFAHIARRGSAASGTGPNMAPHSNLAEHLLECLNVVCGRYARAGDPVANPGVIGPRVPRRAEVIPPSRSWERGWKSRVGGYGMTFGQKMTGTLAEEITTRGDDRIRALFVDGGNPVNAIPDQRRIVAALSELELLVTIDPFMTPTAQLSHYILPPKMMFERADLPSRDYESIVMFRPYTHYAAPVVPPPAGSELVDDWYPFWALARRLGRQIVFDGVELDMQREPDTDALLAILARHGSVPFDEIRRSDAGRFFQVEPQFVEVGTGNARFDVMPRDVASELAEVLRETTVLDAARSGFSHRLIVRRMREVQNTMYHLLPSIRRRAPYNPAYMHPDELKALGLQDGDEIEIVSPHGCIPAIVAADETLRAGVVSMSHGWGGLPDESATYAAVGSSTNLLTSCDDRDRINAMPTMSAVPVKIVRRTVDDVSDRSAHESRRSPSA